MATEILAQGSPAYQRQHPELRSPEDLIHHTLIHDLSVDTHTGFASWSSWLKHAGINNADIKRGMQINNSAAVLQAAIDGQGVALARSVMANDDIATGRLIRLFPGISFSSALAYYVVYRPDGLRLNKVMTFRNWLFDQVA